MTVTKIVIPGNELIFNDSLESVVFSLKYGIIQYPGEVHSARVTASDPGGDSVIFFWEVRPEARYAAYAGQGEVEPLPIEGLVGDHAMSVRFSTPKEAGAYRLFVYAFHGKQQFSTANLPFLVK